VVKEKREYVSGGTGRVRRSESLEGSHFGRPWPRWEVDIRVDRKDVEYGDLK
jgi:hypothetical protein